MKIITLILASLALTSCLSFNKNTARHQHHSANPPQLQIPFSAVDVNQDGNITKAEYANKTSTLDKVTPNNTMMTILIGVGLLVGILIFLTTCYKGPSGIRRE